MVDKPPGLSSRGIHWSEQPAPVEPRPCPQHYRKKILNSFALLICRHIKTTIGKIDAKHFSTNEPNKKTFNSLQQQAEQYV